MMRAEHTSTIQCVAETDPPLTIYAKPRRLGIPSRWIPYSCPFAVEYLALIASKDRPYVSNPEKPVSPTDTAMTATAEMAKPDKKRQRLQTRNKTNIGRAY